jgi:hypothetical protein
MVAELVAADAEGGGVKRHGSPPSCPRANATSGGTSRRAWRCSPDRYSPGSRRDGAREGPQSCRTPRTRRLGASWRALAVPPTLRPPGSWNRPAPRIAVLARQEAGSILQPTSKPLARQSSAARLAELERVSLAHSHPPALGAPRQRVSLAEPARRHLGQKVVRGVLAFGIAPAPSARPTGRLAEHPPDERGVQAMARGWLPIAGWRARTRPTGR